MSISIVHLLIISTVQSERRYSGAHNHPKHHQGLFGNCSDPLCSHLSRGQKQDSFLRSSACVLHLVEGVLR